MKHELKKIGFDKEILHPFSRRSFSQSSAVGVAALAFSHWGCTSKQTKISQNQEIQQFKDSMNCRMHSTHKKVGFLILTRI